MRKSNFRIDEIILVLIVAVIAMVIGVYDKANEPKGADAEKITAMILDDHSISFASNGVVDEAKLKTIKSMNYNDFKNSFNVKNDFCIYIEDENGNLILAKGSPRLSEEEVCRE